MGCTTPKRSIVVDGGLDLFTKHVLDLAVGALGVHLATQLLCGEEFREGAVGCQSLVVLHEKGDEIALTLLGFLLGLCDSLLEVGVFLVVGQSLHDIGNTDFEDDVHTTLEVQTQTDTHFTALLEGPGAEIDFLVLQ